ncbi:hypothetical protein CA233_14925 [Sphingomonas sp. ABOLD]|uniref:Uncharacterized protein n=1 Tax=Sphingomonas trueperi TaxID=53317 RepID=A0A7X5XZM5_9SPHN|nr:MULTISPECIES: hypothetical protein [Sphingomonas]NJB98333.1 hypothetical protein [Sphingomonas trueperi]RSV44754.1 hypothetical protein CA233_14925 [Sphingomonas sp. ABOLD]RSV45439.1 hypothetical protein CA234_00865 [Sphingomonas sp. ABOLE]
MIDGRLFLLITTLICVGAFLNGLRFATKSENPWAGKKLFGNNVGGSELSIAQIRRIGLLQMIAAPIFLLLFAALCFGLFGPVDGIQTIRF